MQCLKCGNEFDDFYECPLCAEAWRKSGRFTRIFTKTEDVLLNFFLAVMVLMVLAQILLRNFFQSGILGGDDLVRHLVLWIAFFGAAIATRSNSHVKIDVVTHLAGTTARKIMEVLVSFFSCGVCAVLVFASTHFLIIEIDAANHSQFFNLPVWAMQIVMPLGYLVITVRFALNGIRGIQEMRGGRCREENP
jgi:TRAP-type C4-dicarboxylate transport system permease small subunit